MIFVSAGHSNTDPGATANGLKESELAVQLRNAVLYCLNEYGVPCFGDGAGKDNKPLREAVKMATDSTVEVEIHFNAANGKASGIEVLANPRDKVLAQKLAGAIHSVTESPLRGDKGYKPENAGQHHRLAFVQAGGLIIEVEFIDNKQRMDTYLGKVWVVARALAKVLTEHIGMEVKQPKEETQDEK